MSTASLINQNHPSFGTKQAYFMFTMKVNGAVTRVLVVEARNAWAVQCMERLLSVDQRVSDTCECAAIFRGDNVGMRGSICEEVEFVDFFTDIVDPDRFLSDTLTIEAFQRALTPADRTHAASRASAAPRVPAPAPTPVHRVPAPAPLPARPAPPLAQVVPLAPKVPEAAPVAKDGQEYNKVLNIVCGLGFKKAQVEPLMDGVDLSNTNEAVRTLLQKLAS